MPLRDFLLAVFVFQGGPLWPHNGCWLGLQPGPPSVEASRIERTRIFGSCVGISLVSYIASSYSYMCFNDILVQRPGLGIFLLFNLVRLILVLMIIVYCRRNSVHEVRHLLYALCFLSLTFMPIIGAITDSADHVHLVNIGLRRLALIFHMMALQGLFFGQVSVQSLLFAVPGNILYFVKCGLHWTSLTGGNFGIFEPASQVSQVWFRMHFHWFPLLHGFTLLFGVIPLWWLSKNRVAKRACAKVAPNFPTNSVVPSSCREASSHTTADESATSSSGSTSHDQGFGTTEATSSPGCPSDDRDHYDPSQSAAPATATVIGRVDFHGPQIMAHGETGVGAVPTNVTPASVNDVAGPPFLRTNVRSAVPFLTAAIDVHVEFPDSSSKHDIPDAKHDGRVQGPRCRIWNAFTDDLVHTLCSRDGLMELTVHDIKEELCLNEHLALEYFNFDLVVDDEKLPGNRTLAELQVATGDVDIKLVRHGMERGPFALGQEASWASCDSDNSVILSDFNGDWQLQNVNEIINAGRIHSDVPNVGGRRLLGFKVHEGLVRFERNLFYLQIVGQTVFMKDCQVKMRGNRLLLTDTDRTIYKYGKPLLQSPNLMALQPDCDWNRDAVYSPRGEPLR